MSSKPLPEFLQGKPPFWLTVCRILASILLGVFLARAHDATFLGTAHGFVAMGLALLCMRTDHVGKSAMFGWLLGLGYFGWTLRWIVEPFLVDVARHGWMAPFAIVLMAGGLALFWAAAFGAARYLGGRTHAVLWVAVTLSLAELARGHVLSGFPWGLLSYSLIGGMGEVWFAWVGPYGANLLMVAVSAALVTFLARALTGGGAGMFGALAGVVVVSVAATWGLSALAPAMPAASEQLVRVIQPNAPQHQKWDRQWMPVFFDRALEQTGAGDAPDVVIWPETSVPTLLNFADGFLSRMSRAARGAPVVAGIQRHGGDDSYFNSAVVIEGPSTITEIADKSHLVPFGEYIPAAWLLEPIGLGPLVEQVAGFRAGTGDGLIEVDGLGLARVLICYEGIFPEEITRGRPRPDVLLILTNDAWFGSGAGPRQHLVQAQARAIEQGLPVVRSANTGISAVIDARGGIVASLPLNTAGYVDANVPAALPPTLYARIGDWPLTGLLLLCLALGVAMRRRNIIDVAQPRG